MDAIERLVAIEDIRGLKARYFRCIDTKDWAGLRLVFCDDAEFDARAALDADGAGIESRDWVYRGGDTIAAFVEAVIGTRRTVHHGHAHEIAIVSATQARGVIAMEDQIWEAQAPFLHGCGHYHETYRREADGWRILNSRLTRLYVKLG